MAESNQNETRTADQYASDLLAKTKRFIEVWNKGTSAKAIAQELGEEESAVTARAVTLRKLGIPLKKLHRGVVYTPEALDELRKLAQGFLPEGAAVPSGSNPKPKNGGKKRKAETAA